MIHEPIHMQMPYMSGTHRLAPNWNRAGRAPSRPMRATYQIILEFIKHDLSLTYMA